MAFGSRFRKGSGTNKFVIFASIAVFGVLAIALLAPSSGFSNNPFSAYPTTVSTVSGSVVTYTILPTVTSTTSLAAVSTTVSDGTTITTTTTVPITINGNLSSTAVSSLSISTVTSTSTSASSSNSGSSSSSTSTSSSTTLPGGYALPPNVKPQLIVSFTLTGQTGSHASPTVCLPLSIVPTGTAPVVLVNGQSPESESYTTTNNQVCVTFTTHFSTDNVALVFTSPISVSTAKTSYPSDTGTSITVSGNVTNAIGIPGTSATVQISNGAGLFVVASTPVNGTTGAFTTTFVSGSNTSSLWVPGSYDVTVSWAATASSTKYTGTGTFQYGAVQTSTTSTSSSSSSGSVTSSGTAVTTHLTTTITSSTTVASTTTITSPGTAVTSTISGSGTTVTTTLSSSTTVGASNSTALIVGIVAVVVAIIAGAVAALALRKK